MLIECSHTGIDKRKAGIALAPGGQALRIGHIGAQAVIGAMKIFKFDARLVLQLLHEVAMPVLPPGKGEQ